VTVPQHLVDLPLRLEFYAQVQRPDAKKVFREVRPVRGALGTDLVLTSLRALVEKRRHEVPDRPKRGG